MTEELKQEKKERHFHRKDVIPRKVAEEQVQLLNDFYDVDFEYLLPAAKTIVEVQTLAITKHIVKGRISIEATGDGLKISQILEKPIGGTKRISYKEAGTMVQIALNRASEGTGEVAAVLGVLSELGSDFFSSEKMSPVDWATAENLGKYFLYV